ncbi:hypothetical protein TNCV_68091 [Trichonephila clavipes]|nr:hypothetical protein TNCV_68091 [Trichonephila clavipes]
MQVGFMNFNLEPTLQNLQKKKSAFGDKQIRSSWAFLEKHQELKDGLKRSKIDISVKDDFRSNRPVIRNPRSVDQMVPGRLKNIKLLPFYLKWCIPLGFAQLSTEITL